MEILAIERKTIKEESGFFDFESRISIIRYLLFSRDFMLRHERGTLESEKTLSYEEIGQMADIHLHQLKKVRRNNEKIQKELGTRTISEILASKETFYMGACVDSTLSFLFKLKDKIPAEKLELGCELLEQNKIGNLTFHLFLIDKSTNPQRVIDFIGKNFISIYEGDYQNPQEWKKITQLEKFSISGEKIKESDSFLTIAEKMGIHLPPELFQSYLAKLQQDNTPANFEQFKQNSPINIKIKRQKSTTEEAVLGVVKD